MAANAIARKSDPRDICLPGFTLKAVGVEVAGQLTLGEWRAAMQFVDRATSGFMWWHGDMLNYGYATYGELASQEDGDGKYKDQTLYNAKWVAERIPISARAENVSFKHHEVIASLPPREQKKWLKQAADNKW
ncbi:MAG: hypothetical protein L0Z50_12840 [Verrucomicrobiales bacterium]|nr:hypothetical protein [Verrucomicrobiales bacterium]